MRTVTADELLEEFRSVETWEERYRCILELSDELNDMPEHLKTEENRVQGCVSNVWLAVSVQPGNRPVVTFTADSDSQIVRGLISMLVMLCSGRPAREILSLDMEGVFEQLGFSQHLSRSRSNGLYSVIKRIRTLAEQTVRYEVLGGESITTC